MIHMKDIIIGYNSVP